MTGSGSRGRTADRSRQRVERRDERVEGVVVIRIESTRGAWVTVGGAVLPGDAAGEPFTDLHDFHQVVNGRAPALRAHAGNLT